MKINNHKLLSNQFWLLQLVIFIAYIAMTLPYPIIPFLFTSIEHSNKENILFAISSHRTYLSLIIGIYPLGLFTGSLLLGRIADKYGKKKALLISLILASITQYISGYLVIHNLFNLLLITRFLSGLFEGNIAIARAALAILCPTEALKKTHFGRTNASLTLGWAVGPLLGTLFLSGHSEFDYSVPFFIGALCTSIICILIYLKFEEPSLQKVSPTQMAQQSHTLFDNKMLLLLLSSLMITLGIDAFYQFLPVYVAVYFPYTPIFVGISITLVAITNALSNLILVSLIGRFISTTNSIIVFPILLGICLLMIGTNKLKFGIFILLPIVGSLIALTMTNLTVLISMTGSQLIQGKLMGLLLSQRTLGTAIITFSMIPLLNYGYNTPFILGGLLVLLSIFLIAYTVSFKIFNSNLNRTLKSPF